MTDQNSCEEAAPGALFRGLGPRPETSESLPVKARREYTSNLNSREERTLPPLPNPWGLTRTQAYIIKRRSEGADLVRLSKEMFIGIKTVNTHSGRAMQKMGAPSIMVAVLMWDREFYRRPEPLSYDEIMRINLGREPTEAERYMNLQAWEASSEVYNYALALARKRLPEVPGLALELAAKRLSEIAK